MNTYLDLTAFMWKFERGGIDKVRLVIHCAPGLAGRLVQALALYGARRKSQSSIVIRGVRQFCAVVRRLAPDDDELLADLDRYEQAYSTAKARKKVPPQVLEERIAAAAQLLRDPESPPTTLLPSERDEI